jgi:hypothetical protein
MDVNKIKLLIVEDSMVMRDLLKESILLHTYPRGWRW